MSRSLALSLSLSLLPSISPSTREAPSVSRSPSSALLPFFGGGFPYQNRRPDKNRVPLFQPLKSEGPSHVPPKDIALGGVYFFSDLFLRFVLGVFGQWEPSPPGTAVRGWKPKKGPCSQK